MFCSRNKNKQLDNYLKKAIHNNSDQEENKANQTQFITVIYLNSKIISQNSFNMYVPCLTIQTHKKSIFNFLNKALI